MKEIKHILQPWEESEHTTGLFDYTTGKIWIYLPTIWKNSQEKIDRFIKTYTQTITHETIHQQINQDKILNLKKHDEEKTVRTLIREEFPENIAEIYLEDDKRLKLLKTYMIIRKAAYTLTAALIILLILQHFKII